MCTVSYLPYGKGFILTSNRDEAPHRSPQRISTLAGTHGQQLFLPQDTGGGSWIVASTTGRIACLLNGAFLNHHRRPPYRRSRGLVVLDSFAATNIPTFWDAYDWEGIEPFTLLHVEGDSLFEGRWDGQRVWLTQKDAAQPHLWASATLYDADHRAARAAWFTNWLSSNPAIVPSEAHRFHRQGGSGDLRNDLVMRRAEGVETVSISQIIRTDTSLEMHYDHLLDGQKQSIKIR
ncbi:MAG: NRDE family protein [Bacteroidota bacterium]